MDTTTTRPKLKIELSPTDKIVEAAAIVGLGFAIIAVGAYWPAIGQKIPIHFTITGEADDWGSKATLFMLPMFAVMTYAALTAVCRFCSPETWNYPVQITEENAERQYRIGLEVMRWLKLQLVWMCAYSNWQWIQTALGKTKVLIPTAVFVGLLAITVTVIVQVVRALRAR